MCDLLSEPTCDIVLEGVPLLVQPTRREESDKLFASFAERLLAASCSKRDISASEMDDFICSASKASVSSFASR